MLQPLLFFSIREIYSAYYERRRIIRSLKEFRSVVSRHRWARDLRFLFNFCSKLKGEKEMKEKCRFCEYERGPLTERPEACITCRDCSNFKTKTRMHPIQAYKYDKLKKEEEWINDQSMEFDRDTALAVLKALAANMRPSHDLFGEPTLVINRNRFEAVRKKFLDVHKNKKEEVK